jgi:diketogulonate reductase-like aldo/keto reductase
LAYLHSKGILPQAYSPLGSTGSPLLSDETATEISQKHGLGVSDVLLGYLGTLPVINTAAYRIAHKAQSRKGSLSSPNPSPPNASCPTYRAP